MPQKMHQLTSLIRSLMPPGMLEKIKCKGLEPMQPVVATSSNKGKKRAPDPGGPMYPGDIADIVFGPRTTTVTLMNGCSSTSVCADDQEFDPLMGIAIAYFMASMGTGAGKRGTKIKAQAIFDRCAKKWGAHWVISSSARRVDRIEKLAIRNANNDSKARAKAIRKDRLAKIKDAKANEQLVIEVVTGPKLKKKQKKPKRHMIVAPAFK